jgi:hypothetical protein
MARQRLWWLGALIFIGLVTLITSNSAQWIFLARVQWVALLALTILPLLAHTSGRELLIGAYDLIFYRIHKVSDEKDVYVEPTDPGSILAGTNENDDRIILVAAGGGGIQASAWTARVLTGLEEICARNGRVDLFGR